MFHPHSSRLVSAFPALVAAVFLAFPCLAEEPPEPATETAEEKDLLDFRVWDEYNQPIAAKQWLTGTPLLVDFWATWCTPCRFTLPEIESLHQHYGERLKVLGVSVDSGAGGGFRARKFAKEGGVSYPIFHDLRGEGRKATGVHLLPVLFLFDADGKLVRDWWGEPDFDEVREAIESVVVTAPASSPPS